ncbi:MAG: response regulator [Nitrospiraceae bacterium]|nr:MAG: response regulator [Nitrospiraceae bacterium]
MKEINFVKRYSIISLLAVVVFGFAFGHLLSRSMEQIMFKNAIHDMADIVNQNVVKHFKADELTKPKKGSTYKKFSHRMEHLSLNKNIKKVKIWNREKQIVWSGNRDLVGKTADEDDNSELQKVLTGEIVAETHSSGETEHTLHNTFKAERIMEIYIPITYGSQDDIQAIFEVYVNLDYVYEHIAHHKKMIWFWTISGFSLLYVVLFGGFWSASRRINKQTREITQSKQDWEETFNTITDMITIHDMEFNILRANKAAEQGLGLSGQDSTYHKCYTYYHHTEEPPEWCPGIKCLEKGEPASAEIFEPVLNRHFDVRTIPRFDNNDNMIGFIHDVRDITNIKKAEEEKAKLHDQFLQVQKMDSIGRLAGGIAHDFNNILSVIIGFSEIALNELSGNDGVRDHIKTIHGAGEKAAILTKQLLAFSRKQVLEMKAVSINDTIENMTKMLGRLIPANITFSFNPHIEEQKILADPVQLEQILLNLVVNARDAMPDGGKLSIKTAEVEFKEEDLLGNEKVKPGSYVMLSVTDTGTGMSQAVIEKIFEPFFSTKGVGKGTGMGLSTVYGIVKQHEAYIDVNSEPGRGTSFEVYFPVTEGDISETCDETLNRNVTGNETVLVVDDEPLILKVIANLLNPLGYNVLEASNGEDALQISDTYKEKIDLLLTDVVMPGMNGNELAERLSKKWPETGVIFMSGYTDDAIAHHGVLNEGVVLVNKPIKGDVLSKMIRQVLDDRSNKNEVICSTHVRKGMDILLVDDDENIRKMTRVFLKDYDCTIETAENGHSAFEKFTSGTYDLVFMDMQMPVMDGLTSVRKMRKWEQEHGVHGIRIIALTGNSSSEDIEKCYRAGYSDHMSKPIKKDLLMQAVIRHSSTGTPVHCTNKENQKDKIVARVDPDLKELVPEYLEERQSDIKRMQEAMKKGDYEAVRIIGHTLKGSGGGFGFEPITEIGLEIEDAATGRSGEDVEEHINECISKLSEYLDSVDVIYE